MQEKPHKKGKRLKTTFQGCISKIRNDDIED
jgi:hypothetical protein